MNTSKKQIHYHGNKRDARKEAETQKNQLLIDKMIVKDCKRRLTLLVVAWIDYHQAYDMVPHSWIQMCTEMFVVAVKVRSLVNASMKQWNTELTASNQRLGNEKIRRGIFYGDSLSAFVLVMIPLILVLRQTKTSYELKK